MLNPNLHIPHPSQWNCPLSVSSNSLHTEQKWAEPNTVPHPVLETRLIHERNGHSEGWRQEKFMREMGIVRTGERSTRNRHWHRRILDCLLFLSAPVTRPVSPDTPPGHALSQATHPALHLGHQPPINRVARH